MKFDFYLVAAPHLAGFLFKLFVGILEMPVIGSFVVSILKKQNKIVEVFDCSFLSFLSSFCLIVLATICG